MKVGNTEREKDFTSKDYSLACFRNMHLTKYVTIPVKGYFYE